MNAPMHRDEPEPPPPTDPDALADALREWCTVMRRAFVELLPRKEAFDYIAMFEELPYVRSLPAYSLQPLLNVARASADPEVRRLAMVATALREDVYRARHARDAREADAVRRPPGAPEH